MLRYVALLFIIGKLQIAFCAGAKSATADWLTDEMNGRQVLMSDQDPLQNENRLSILQENLLTSYLLNKAAYEAASNTPQNAGRNFNKPVARKRSKFWLAMGGPLPVQTRYAALKYPEEAQQIEQLLQRKMKPMRYGRK